MLRVVRAAIEEAYAREFPKRAAYDEVEEFCRRHKVTRKRRLAMADVLDYAARHLRPMTLLQAYRKIK